MNKLLKDWNKFEANISFSVHTRKQTKPAYILKYISDRGNPVILLKMALTCCEKPTRITTRNSIK